MAQTFIEIFEWGLAFIGRRFFIRFFQLSSRLLLEPLSPLFFQQRLANFSLMRPILMP